MPVTEFLDLPLAWRRVKWHLDHGTSFTQHPYERRLIELDADVWLRELAVVMAARTAVEKLTETRAALARKR